MPIVVPHLSTGQPLSQPLGQILLRFLRLNEREFAEQAKQSRTIEIGARERSRHGKALQKRRSTPEVCVG